MSNLQKSSAFLNKTLMSCLIMRSPAVRAVHSKNTSPTHLPLVHTDQFQAMYRVLTTFALMNAILSKCAWYLPLNYLPHWTFIQFYFRVRCSFSLPGEGTEQATFTCGTALSLFALGSTSTTIQRSPRETSRSAERTSFRWPHLYLPTWPRSRKEREAEETGNTPAGHPTAPVVVTPQFLPNPPSQRDTSFAMTRFTLLGLLPERQI